jgi:hypothetical protein
MATWDSPIDPLYLQACGLTNATLRAAAAEMRCAAAALRAESRALRQQAASLRASLHEAAPPPLEPCTNEAFLATTGQ